MLQKIAGFFLFSSALLCAAPSSAQTGPGFNDVNSVRFGRELTPSGLKNFVMTRTDAGGWNLTYGAPYPHFGWYQGSTNKPAGVTVQYFKFKIKSEGLFTAKPCAHLTFIARWDGDYGASYNRGRALTVGDTSRNPDWPGCGTTPATTLPGYASTQGEIIWSTANEPLWDKKTNLLIDNKWYDVEIHVADNGYAYWVRDTATGDQLVNEYHYIPDDGRYGGPSEWSIIKNTAQGIAVALTFTDYNGAFTFIASDFQYGWF